MTHVINIFFVGICAILCAHSPSEWNNAFQAYENVLKKNIISTTLSFIFLYYVSAVIAAIF